MKILWHSAPAFHLTGYGVQTKAFVQRLLADGHEVYVSVTTPNLPEMVWEGIHHLPSGDSQRGIEGVIHWTKIFRPDVVITLYDIWDFPSDFGAVLKEYGAKWMPIIPIDHDPIPERHLEALKSAHVPTAMSLFGQEQMKRNGIKGEYVPLGVDTKAFSPKSVKRKDYGIPEKHFLVGCVANNVDPFGRKGYQETLEAFGRFHKKHPNSSFYFHGDPHQESGGAVDLAGLAKKFGFVNNFYNSEWWSYKRGYTDEMMANLYSLFDVYMLLSGGEGFGIPLIEAQACGTPVIATDFTAPKDLVSDGWKIPIKGKRWTVMSSYWGIANVDKAVEALEEAHKKWLNGTLRTGGGSDYDFDKIYKEKLIPVLERNVQKNV